MKEEIIGIAAVSVLCIGFIVCIFMLVKIFFELNRLKKLDLRNQEVYNFRIYWLHRDIDVYFSLPTYDEMVNGKEPLKIESYIDISSLEK